MSDSLSTRLARVAKRLGHGVDKDQPSPMGYRYTSAASVNRLVGPYLTAEGITVSVDFDMLPGAPDGHAWVKARVTFRCGDETIETSGLGAGKPIKGDEKALMKAESVAVKYAYVHAFVLGMGEDPESDDDSQAAPEPEKLTAQRPAVDPAKAAVEVLSAIRAALDGGGVNEIRAAIQNGRDVLPYLSGKERADVIAAAQRAKGMLEKRGVRV